MAPRPRLCAQHPARRHPGDATGTIAQEEILPFTPWWLLTSVDLHHVTGLSLLLLAGLVRFRPGWLFLAGVVVVGLAGPLVRGLGFGMPLLDGPLTPVLGGAPNVYYAAVPWVVFPLAGAVFGRLLAEASDRDRIFRIGGLAGLGLLVAGGVLILLTKPDLDVSTYWRMPPAFIVGTFGVVLVWLALCDLAARRAWLDLRLGVVYHWSDRVIPMYFVHWLVVGWGIAFVGFRDLGLPAILVATPCAVIVTTLCSRFAIGLGSLPWRIRDRLRLRDHGLAAATGLELVTDPARAEAWRSRKGGRSMSGPSVWSRSS
jgi:hypothetical protein